MAREQFTFYRSYWEAAKLIKKPADRLSLLEAIAAYALDEEERKLTDTAAPNFLLIKPTLDASAKKAKAGSAGGSRKQTGSKTEAPGKHPTSKAGGSRKQTGREKENEVEDEIEVEVEGENECSIPCSSEQGADARARDSSLASSTGDDESRMELRARISLMFGNEPAKDLQEWMDAHPEIVAEIRRDIEAEEEV